MKRNGHANGTAPAPLLPSIGPVWLTDRFRAAAHKVLWKSWEPRDISPKEWAQGLAALTGKSE